MKPTSVYYLLDPLTQEVRYVGISTSPELRFHKGHLRVKGDYHHARWIQSLHQQSLRPILKVKCWVEDSKEAKRIEVFLIATLRSNGARLTNTTRGGDGGDTFTGRTHTIEVRQRLSDAHKKITGWKHTSETKLKMSISAKGKHDGHSWNRGLKGVQVPWNKGLKGRQVAWNKGLTGK